MLIRNDWEHYLNCMEVKGSYGDHPTIQRASEIFNVYYCNILITRTASN